MQQTLSDSALVRPGSEKRRELTVELGCMDAARSSWQEASHCLTETKLGVRWACISSLATELARPVRPSSMTNRPVSASKWLGGMSDCVSQCATRQPREPVPPVIRPDLQLVLPARPSKEAMGLELETILQTVQNELVVVSCRGRNSEKSSFIQPARHMRMALLFWSFCLTEVGC